LVLIARCKTSSPFTMSRLKQGFAGRSFKGRRDRAVGVELPLVERLIDYRNFRTNCPRIRRSAQKIAGIGPILMPPKGRWDRPRHLHGSFWTFCPEIRTVNTALDGRVVAAYLRLASRVGKLPFHQSKPRSAVLNRGPAK
jgi:hypothetical protein